MGSYHLRPHDQDSNSSSRGCPVHHHAADPRAGIFPSRMKAAPATDVDRAAVESFRTLGMKTVDATWPDIPHSALMLLLFSDAAAAFEELTLLGKSRTSRCSAPMRVPTFFACRASCRRWTACRQILCVGALWPRNGRRGSSRAVRLPERPRMEHASFSSPSPSANLARANQRHELDAGGRVPAS